MTHTIHRRRSPAFFSPRDFELYCDVQGRSCPECASTSLRRDEPALNGLEVKIDVMCEVCFARWTEWYRLDNCYWQVR